MTNQEEVFDNVLANYIPTRSTPSFDPENNNGYADFDIEEMLQSIWEYIYPSLNEMPELWEDAMNICTEQSKEDRGYIIGWALFSLDKTCDLPRLARSVAFFLKVFRPEVVEEIKTTKTPVSINLARR